MKLSLMREFVKLTENQNYTKLVLEEFKKIFETYGCDVSVVWKRSNTNPGITLLCNAVKICFS